MNYAPIARRRPDGKLCMNPATGKLIRSNGPSQPCGCSTVTPCTPPDRVTVDVTGVLPSRTDGSCEYVTNTLARCITTPGDPAVFVFANIFNGSNFAGRFVLDKRPDLSGNNTDIPAYVGWFKCAPQTWTIAHTCEDLPACGMVLMSLYPFGAGYVLRIETFLAVSPSVIVCTSVVYTGLSFPDRRMTEKFHNFWSMFPIQFWCVPGGVERSNEITAPGQTNLGYSGTAIVKSSLPEDATNYDPGPGCAGGDCATIKCGQTFIYVYNCATGEVVLDVTSAGTFCEALYFKEPGWYLPGEKAGDIIRLLNVVYGGDCGSDGPAGCPGIQPPPPPTSEELVKFCGSVLADCIECGNCCTSEDSRINAQASFTSVQTPPASPGVDYPAIQAGLSAAVNQELQPVSEETADPDSGETITTWKWVGTTTAPITPDTSKTDKQRYTAEAGCVSGSPPDLKIRIERQELGGAWEDAGYYVMSWQNPLTKNDCTGWASNFSINNGTFSGTYSLTPIGNTCTKNEAGDCVSTSGDAARPMLRAAATPVRPSDIWNEWHRRAARPVIDHDAEQTYIAGLAARTGCGVCVDHWLAYLAVNTIDTSTPAAYTRATWAAHEAVNFARNVPGITFERAAELYGW